MSDAKMEPAAGDAVLWNGSDGGVYTYGKALDRTCVRCRKSFPWDGQKFKTHCPGCYGKHVRKCQNAECTNNLAIEAPPYQRVCTSCWLTAKAKKYKQCPRCPPERATHLRCPLDKECCAECEVRAVPMIPVP